MFRYDVYVNMLIYSFLDNNCLEKVDVNWVFFRVIYSSDLVFEILEISFKGII